MAQKVNIVLVDDLDGSDATETVQFALDGASYEIDLSDVNAQALRDSVAEYAQKARKVGANGANRSRRRSGDRTTASAKEVRAWARSAGLDVPERGRVPEPVRQAYRDAR